MEKKQKKQSGLYRLYQLLFLSLIVGLGFSSPAMATDGHTPFFAGNTGSPNVMIIFDNSDSMQDSPYFRDDGNTYRPNTRWRHGVKINPDCNGDGTADDPCIAEKADGGIDFDWNKHVTETELTLPGQNPPNLPGLSSTDSTITSFSGSACPAPNESLTCSNIIKDSNIDWSIMYNWNASRPWLYWKVRITNIEDSTFQERSIESGHWGNQWTVAGGDIQYDTNKTYKYELVTGSPGEATRFNPVTEKDRLYDRNFDWSTVKDWSNFSAKYYNREIEVYAGTNAGERRRIISRWWEGGQWQVDSDFPVPSDITTRYRIIGTDNNDNEKTARGGNHPDSKMYQAKLALQQFLTSDSIKTTDTHTDGTTSDRYLMNIGFASFLQARSPRTNAKYYRKRGLHHPAQFSYMYRENRDTSATEYIPTGCVGPVGSKVVPAGFSGTFTEWGIKYSNILHNGTVDRLYRKGYCDEQTIRYQVTYSCAPGDDGVLPDRVKVNLKSHTTWTDPALAGTDPDGNPQWGYTWMGWRWFADNGTGDCTTFDPPDPLWGDNHLIKTGECNWPCRNHPERTETPYYETTWRSTWGDLRKTDPATPGYINKNPASGATYIVTPAAGHCSGIPGDDWLCTNPNPEDISGDGRGDWTLLTSDLVDVPTNSHGAIGTITSVIFDNSDYRYPGTGNAHKPHGWSYKKTERNPAWLTDWRYKKDDNTYLDEDDRFIYVEGRNQYSSIWPDDVTFPAVTGDEFTNYTGDDHVVFINLPEYDATVSNKGDDFSGTNIQKILNYISLARIPELANADKIHTMAPISKGALTVNYDSDEPGSGTPLAASLSDARKYLKSYMEQDPFSLGDCRKNYIILLTDGTESAGGDPVAEATALQNLVVSGEKRPVKVYVIGFGLDSSSKTLLNNIAVAGGSGQAYYADNVEQLVGILAHDITSDILSGSYGRGKVALTRGGLDSSHGLTLYNAYFDYPTWRGHLEAWQLYAEDQYDPTTGALLHKAGAIKRDAIGKKVGEPHWSDGCGDFPPASAGDPNAGCIMAAANANPGTPPDGPISRRDLYTTAGGIKINFAPANAAALLAALNPGDVNNDGLTNELDAKTVINYIHHPGFDGGNYVGTRDVSWPLADIYNSGPVLVTAPMRGNCDIVVNDNGTPADKTDDTFTITAGTWLGMDGYCQHAQNKKDRETMLYFSTNGGMVQAITAGKPGTAMSGGNEKWGYIPGFVLPKLKELRKGHRFTMDLSVMVSEVDISDGLTGGAGDWKTILVAGQRKGGSGYIALDITDPDTPLFMWEFTDDNLANTWSRPSVARIMIDGTKQSVLIFGGGHSLSEDKGNRLYIVKAADGAILKEIEVGSDSNNVPSQILTTLYLTDNVGNVVDYRTNIQELPDGTVVDYSDRRYLTETAYFGDTSGDVWRIDGLNTESGTTWEPTLTNLYEPDDDYERPIYYPPVITDIKMGKIDPNPSTDTVTFTGCVKRYLMFGTGDEQAPTKTKKGDGSPLIDYVFEIEDSGSIWNGGTWDTNNTVLSGGTWKGRDDADDEDFLTWRFYLGMQLPSDNGFLLKPDKTRAKKGDPPEDGAEDDRPDILSSYIYLINKAKYDSESWSIDGNGHLLNPEGKLAAQDGEYLFRNSGGDLFNDVGMTTADKVADGGSYTQLDFALWLTDKDGNFYDSADGEIILDTSGYYYDKAGYWLDGDGGNRVTVNGDEVRLIEDPGAGEKLLAAPVGYAGYLYFTTYTPEGGCAVGTTYFYGLKASTCSLKGGTGTIEQDKAGNPYYSDPRRRISLGRGMSAGVTLGGGMAYVPVGKNVFDIDAQVGETKLKYWRQN